MQTRRIGSLNVSVVGLGCNNFGWWADQAASARVIDAALDAGINFLDTADMYDGGNSEAFIGRALGARRKDIVIATKFGQEVGPELKGGAHPDYIPRALESSLKRLNTDYIDLYLLHWPDPKVPIADTLGALDMLVRAGKVREIGCSNFTAEMLRESAAAAKGARFCMVQNEYSLLQREPETAVLPECQHSGIAFVPYFPLASGLLSGKYRKDRARADGRLVTNDWFKHLLTEQNLERVERLIAFSEARGRSILELAFSWLLAKQPVASVIAGARTPEQVRANASAAGWALTSAELGEIDSLLAA